MIFQVIEINFYVEERYQLDHVVMFLLTYLFGKSAVKMPLNGHLSVFLVFLIKTRENADLYGTAPTFYRAILIYRG